MNFMIVHNYYQENYLDPDFMERITDRRKFVADSLANTNSLSLAMLELGKGASINGQLFLKRVFTFLKTRQRKEESQE